MLNVNVVGVQRMMHFGLPLLRESCDPRFIAISSIAQLPDPFVGAYGVTKSCVEPMLSCQGRFDSGMDGSKKIHYISIQPGPVVTKFAGKTEFGDRTDLLPYQAKLKDEKQVWERGMAHGQECEAVTNAIIEALTHPDPEPWYQTSYLVRQAMTTIYNDPTGKQYQLDYQTPDGDEIIADTHRSVDHVEDKDVPAVVVLST